MTRTTLAALATALLCAPAFADDKTDPKTPKPKKTNRLAKEISPYLLQHAHNPVDWYPWGEEAFARAKKEGKIVFLSIGYSSCHWCHVMEKESFADEEVAKLLNEHFVCIKVDREERPDIDNVYMTAINVMGQNGGWPLSMFLTPDAKPVIGGTYWPKEDKEIDGKKVHGFKSILNLVAKTYAESKKDIEDDAEKNAKATALALSGRTRGLALLELDRDLVTATLDSLNEQYDRAHGGFGSAERRFRGPKFPTPPRLVLLGEEAARGSKHAASMLELTLDRMARGGIYDHLGGGFHRYSTERTWTVPHFEKMLYDNAQLVEVYALAWKRTKHPPYEHVVRETLAFIDREMTSPDGVFYSALDADSEGEEGKFYVWTARQLTDVLPTKADADLFRTVFGVNETPNFEGKYYIPLLPRPIDEQAKEMKTTEAELLKKLEPLKQKLLAERGKRERPFLDTKVLTAWNGQMIAAYAVAGQVLGDKKYLEKAGKAADFLLAKLRNKDGRLLRTYAAAPGGKPEARLNGYLDDYAFLVHGLLCLHDATNDKRWLDEAKALTDTMTTHHADKDSGGFFYTSNDHEKLFARSKDQHDGAQPSGNSVAARNLVRLWGKTGEAKFGEQAEKTFRSLAVPLKNDPDGVATLVSALGLYLEQKDKKK